MDALGRHIVAEFFDCAADLLDDAVWVEKVMIQAAEESGATVIGATFHHFAPYGVSGMVVIAESHLAIHTWPEYGFAAADFFTCGPAVDPWQATHVLKSMLKASHAATFEIQRGQKALLRHQHYPLGQSQGPLPQKPKREVWFTQRSAGLAISVRHDATRIFRKKTDFQQIEVYQTEAFGRSMVLDGSIVLTENDEFAYHEMLVHVPMNAHLAPKRVLVLGGGDGGVAKELLKYPEIEKIDLVEVDKAVAEASAQFFPSIAESLQHPTVQCHWMEASDYVHGHAPNSTYDLILVDVANPAFPAQLAEKPGFFEQLYQLLAPNAIMCLPTGSPKTHAEGLVLNFRKLKQVFGEGAVFPYMAWMPAHPTGIWTYACCTKGTLNPAKQVQHARQQQLIAAHPLNYYTEALHQACFVLPNFVSRLI